MLTEHTDHLSKINNHNGFYKINLYKSIYNRFSIHTLFYVFGTQSSLEVTQSQTNLHNRCTKITVPEMVAVVQK